MKFAATSLFAVILVNPLGGGKVPAISQAHMAHLPTVGTLLLVLVLSLIQVAVLVYLADHVAAVADRLKQWLMSLRPAQVTVRWAKAAAQRFAQTRVGRWLAGGGDHEHRTPNVSHPVLQYVAVGFPPIAPAGGGMYWAIFLKELWKLDSRLAVPIIAVGNWMGFVLAYWLADVFGLLAFLAGFVAVLAIGFLGNKSLTYYRSRRPALA